MGSGPHSVQQARRWVIGVITDIGRDELVDNAELGVSELVTNAVLHGNPPIQVRVRGTREHPRIEVVDTSREPPVLPRPHEIDLDRLELDDEDLLVPFGHGLDIVARCADAWGAEIEEDGKVVWFVPAAHSREVGVPGSITGQTVPHPRRSTSDSVTIKLVGTPLDEYTDFERHFRALRREVRLLALAHEADYPLAKRLSDLFGSLERELREGIGHDQIESARANGQQTADLDVRMTPDAAARMGRFVELLDFADDFCRRERMLSLARSEEQVAFQSWFFGEFVRQQAGRPPTPRATAFEGSSSATSASV